MAYERPSDFYGENGAIAFPKLRAFVRFVLSDAKRSFSGDIRIHRTAAGQNIIEESPAVPFTGAFSVSLVGSQKLSISEGFVNGRMPMIDGVFLDGTLRDGKTSEDGIPQLEITDDPSDRNRSWVGLLVQIDPETGAMDPEDENALTIAHRPELHEKFAEGGAPDEEGSAFWPLAHLHWSRDGKRIDRARQIAFFDQTHRFQAGDEEEETKGRHWFRPAG